MRISPAQAVAALVVALTLSGCSTGTGVDTSGGPAATSTPPSTPPSSSPPVTSAAPTPSAFPEQAAILAQYRAFFAAITPASKMKRSARYEFLKKLATDPELTRVLGGLAASTAAGEVDYGQPVVRPVIKTVVRANALLTDCQDTSRAGRMKASTREKVTVGHKNDLATVTMKRGADGVWRMATIVYAPAGSCTAAG